MIFLFKIINSSTVNHSLLICTAHTNHVTFHLAVLRSTVAVCANTTQKA